jgi:hypothetical protein
VLIPPRFDARHGQWCTTRPHQGSTLVQAGSRPRGCKSHHHPPIILHHQFFPPGTKVKLFGFQAAALNSKRGAVVGGKAALWGVVVLVDGDTKAKGYSFENLGQQQQM